MLDIHATRPRKAQRVFDGQVAMATMTKALAVELAPDVRVNGIALGAILWAESGSEDSERRPACCVAIRSGASAASRVADAALTSCATRTTARARPPDRWRSRARLVVIHRWRLILATADSSPPSEVFAWLIASRPRITPATDNVRERCSNTGRIPSTSESVAKARIGGLARLPEGSGQGRRHVGAMAWRPACSAG